MANNRIWYPPEHDAWLLIGCEYRPETAEEVALMADDFGCEPEEVDAILGIAESRDMKTHPFVVVTEEESEHPSFSVEVIAVAGTVGHEVYKRYNG